MLENSNQTLSNWIKQEVLAEEMISLIGNLYRKNNVIITLFNKGLINKSVIDILTEHQESSIFLKNISAISLHETFPILQHLQQLHLGSAIIDIGMLALQFRNIQSLSLIQFLQQQLAEIINKEVIYQHSGQDVVLYGFGRIGRILSRIILQQTGSGGGLRLKAIVLRKSNIENDLEKRANLLQHDSVHGKFKGKVLFDNVNQTLLVNGNLIHVIYADNPSLIDYTKYDINNAILIDNTGKWRDNEGLSQHLKANGIQKVILTAPAKGDIKNIVYGVNHHSIQTSDKIISAASCTTNAIVPILKIIHDQYKILHGHIETIHAYTNDQNLIDNYHKGSRRGRSAALNMVITETGAATAATKALPELTGKLTGSAIRVPTPNVSLAVLNLQLEESSTLDEFNHFLFEKSLFSDLHKQIGFSSSSEAVSTDFVGTQFAGIIDAKATKVQKNNVVVYIWYDNEYGYSSQVVRLVKHISGVYPKVYP